jgi:crotonobetainyl-CoA:carnitine CoA-transferase CaiB-like acyl-CoA transferase
MMIRSEGSVNIAMAAPSNQPPLLDGVRVVEFSQLLAAPFCGLTLSDLGADVIKVEPRQGDEVRRFPPYFEGGESAWFHAVNRGKRGVALGLGDPRAKEIVGRLIEGANVVIDNLGESRGRLGIDPDEALRRHPKLVWCSITGLGENEGGRAIDPSLQAEMGMMATTGERDGPPARIQAPTIDLMTGMYAVQTILAALWRVERGGAGAFLDCAMLDAAATLIGPVALRALGGLPSGRIGSESHVLVPSASFEASDGVHVQVIALTEGHWRAICAALSHPEWADDPRCRDNDARLANRDFVNGLIRDLVATHTADHWVDAITGAGGLCVRVKEIDDAWSAPRLERRGLLGTIGTAGFDSFAVPVMSLARSASPTALAPGPTLGQHSDEILQELGIDGDQVAALFADGVVVGPRGRRTSRNTAKS